MQTQSLLQKALLKKFSELQARNRTYSLRAFSKKARLSPATMSLVLSGRRKLSRALVEKVCDALLFDPQQRAEILGPFLDHDRHEAAEQMQSRYSQLNLDQFRAMSEWYYLAILSLIKTEGFRNDPEWIAGRLGITRSETTEAINRLKRLGLLKTDSKGRLKRTSQSLRTSDDLADISIRRAHLETLELAGRSLEGDPVEARDLTSLTLAIRKSKLPHAKALIRRFQDEFDALMETSNEPLDEVYRLSVALFPLTRLK